MGQCLILGLWKKGFGVCMHAVGDLRLSAGVDVRCAFAWFCTLSWRLPALSLCQIGYITVKYFAEYCIYVKDFLYFQKFIVHLLIYVIFCFFFFFHGRNLLVGGRGHCFVLVDLLFLFILYQLCTFVFGCHFYLFQLSMLMTQAHLMLQLLRVSWMHPLFSLYAENLPAEMKCKLLLGRKRKKNHKRLFIAMGWI